MPARSHVPISGEHAADATGQLPGLDVEEAIDVLLRDLRTSRDGLSSAEAQRRTVQYGPNELRRRQGTSWLSKVAAQLVQPLALLLWVAAGLEFAIGNHAVGIAVVLVIVINAAMALIQERQAERSVEALSAYLPQRTTVTRDGHLATVAASELVPGDIIELEEGERIPADVRLIEGTIELDMSALTGESEPVLRAAEMVDAGVPRLQARGLAFMGTTCTEGEARAVVFATGMHTELGRIASVSQRVGVGRSPLERQVRKLSWLIAAVGVALSIAFVPIAVFVLRPALTGASVRLRSFTPAGAEVGGAGHNALGAWLWLEAAGRLACPAAGRGLRQEIAGQVLPVEVVREAGQPAVVWMDQSPPYFGEVAGDRAGLAVCLGLGERDLLPGEDAGGLYQCRSSAGTGA
jgi:E1-E2 ATPase/Cation transporter/ATPase, N-terminus